MKADRKGSGQYRDSNTKSSAVHINQGLNIISHQTPLWYVQNTEPWSLKGLYNWDDLSQPLNVKTAFTQTISGEGRTTVVTYSRCFTWHDQGCHLLLLMVELRLLVHQVLFQVGQHFHRDVHLPGELQGLVLKLLFLLAEQLALVLGPLQLGALSLQLGLETAYAGRYFLLHLRDDRC